MSNSPHMQSAIETLRAIETFNVDEYGYVFAAPLRENELAALAKLETLLQAAEQHLRHTDRFCTDRDDEADLTCPTHRALAAAVRDAKGDTT